MIKLPVELPLVGRRTRRARSGLVPQVPLLAYYYSIRKKDTHSENAIRFAAREALEVQSRKPGLVLKPNVTLGLAF